MYNHKSTYHTIFKLRFNNTFNNNIKLIQPIYRRINKLSKDHQINLKYITNYEIPNTPPWINQKISLNTSLDNNKKKKASKWMSLCCTVGYKWVTVMDGVKFEFNNIISLYKKNDSE